MKELYGVYKGCIYEGGGCDSQLYTTKERAREACLEHLKKEQAEDDEVYADEPEDKPVWAEREENYWTDGMDCIWLKPFTVVED